MSARDGLVMPEPLAFFFTWTTYGTWLPGDERGWVRFHKGHQMPDPPRKLEAMARMTEDACRLDDEERQLVERTVAEHCAVRGWTLHAVNCRSNHVHVVVAANRTPSEMRRQLKAWTARKLKELAGRRAENAKPRENWWTERGSKRQIFDEEGLESAIAYVRDGQDARRWGNV
jgi:REP element-mobilizing transposase RayT